MAELSQEAYSASAARRLVLFLPGHDPTDMDYHHGRFANQAGRFAALWSFEVSVSDRLDDDKQHFARWDVEARGPDWVKHTEYRVLRWEDIVVALDDRPDAVRLWCGLGGLVDFLVNGALRYFDANFYYGCFFLFPFVTLAFFAAVGAFAGWLTDRLVLSIAPPSVALVLGVVAAVLVFFGLFRQPGRHLRLHQALDDWDLARNYLHGNTPALSERLGQFADELVEAVRSKQYDEILLVGHSLGATLVLEVLDHALDREPALAAGPTRLNLLTCGATIPKFVLHKKGGKVHRQAQRVASTPGLTWIEFQSKHDFINFHEFHPIVLRDVEFDTLSAGAPMLRNARLRDMLTPEKFARIRWRFMRVHYQFLLANERKALYDYFMFALGPLAFADIAASPQGPVGRFGPDGSLIA